MADKTDFTPELTLTPNLDAAAAAAEAPKAPEAPSLTLDPNGTAAVMVRAPTLEVMATIALRKSTRRPWPSVRHPSSSTCSSRFHTSACAFSISSSSTTQ